MLPRTPLLAALLPLFTAACSLSSAEPTKETPDSSEGAFGDRVGHDTLTTTEPGITLFDGYNSLFDLRRSGCVVADSNARSPSVGQPAQSTTVKLVKSDTELAKELGVDGSLNVKAPMVSGSGSASLLRSFKGSTSSVNYLIQAVQSYVVVSNAPVSLTEEAKNLLLTRPHDFLVRCGDRFINAATYQAKIEALVTFETSSEEHALRLQGEVSAGGTVASTVGLEGGLKARLSDVANQSDVRSSITITAQGFDLTGNETLVGIEGTVEQKLTRIDQASGALRASLLADREKDAAGYFANRTRRAIPAVLHVVRYGMATNAPNGVDSSHAFKENQRMMRDTENYLRAFSQLKLKMEHAWRYEISEFQQAGPEAQAFYNVAPPARPRRRLPEIAEVATTWASRFRSDDGIRLGRDLAAVQDAIANCAENAKSGDFTECRPGTDPSTLAEHLAAQAAIDEYLKTGRVLRMRAWVTDKGAEKSYAQALAACANSNGYVNRLPTAEEARYLGPLVLGWGGGERKSTWTADSGACRYADSGMPFYTNPLEGADQHGCESWSVFSGGSRAVVCVPQTGPIGKRDDL